MLQFRRGIHLMAFITMTTVMVQAVDEKGTVPFSRRKDRLRVAMV